MEAADIMPERPPKEFFRFLIVDDEPVALRLLRSILESDGYEQIDLAESGEQALSLFADNSYQVVIVDKNLPGTNGLEVLRRGKEMQPAAEFIMITAYGSLESAIAAMDAGAFSYLTKPFNDVKLVLERVGSALERVVVRMHNEILADRLRMVVEELERTNRELEQQRPKSSPEAQQQEQLLQRMSQAVGHLRKISRRLEKLRHQARGRSAELLAGLGKGIAAVANLLAHDLVTSVDEE